MTHPHSNINQLVTHQERTIKCNLHTPISCKFLLKFTHKAQLLPSWLAQSMNAVLSMLSYWIALIRFKNDKPLVNKSSLILSNVSYGFLYREKRWCDLVLPQAPCRVDCL
jgi:hypothetical protein